MGKDKQLEFVSKDLILYFSNPKGKKKVNKIPPLKAEAGERRGCLSRRLFRRRL